MPLARSPTVAIGGIVIRLSFQGARSDVMRPIVPAMFCSLIGGLLPAHAADPARPRVENVIVVTWDGFRPEEFFGGAQAELLDRRPAGCPTSRP